MRRGRRGPGPGLLGASAVMAAGTVVSRGTGVVRAAVVVAALGLGLTAESFNIPNTIPNMLYILVAGGVLNSALVPQLVRAMRDDADGGQAYAQRLFSVVTVVLLVTSVAAVVAAPLIVRLFVSGDYLHDPQLRPYLDSMVAFARFCLPQIFFYGLYVVAGQMLNARGRFGPYMWSPVLNNLVVIAVFGSFLVVVGPTADRPLTSTAVAWLGLGSTAGIAVQALVLLPVLRRSGLRLRLRRDVRGVGLGKAGRLAAWTVAYVLLNQLAYLAVVRAASSGAAASAGLTVYTNAHLLIMVPHAVITVSLATAMLPALSHTAARGDLTAVRDELVGALRTSLALMVPITCLLVALSVPVVEVIFGFGGAAGDSRQVALVAIAFLPGLVAFTAHYLALRGFYAVEDTRTPFVIQLAVAAVIVANALLVVRVVDVRATAAGLALGWSAAYAVGAVVSLAVLGRRIGRIDQRALLRHVVILTLATLPATGLAAGAVLATRQLVPASAPAQLTALLATVAAGTLGVLAFLLTTRLVRVREVDAAVRLVSARLRPRRSRTGGPAGPSMGASSGDGSTSGGT